MASIVPGESLSQSVALLQNSEYLGVLIASLDGIIDANDAFLNMVGLSREEMVAGQIDWRTMTPAEYRLRDERGLEELRQKGVCVPFEKEYVLRDGTRLPILIGAVRLKAEPLKWVCWVVNLRTQKQAAAAEKKALALETELEAELSGAFRIYDISSRMLSKTDTKELLLEILDAAMEVTAAEFGNIQLLEDGFLRIVAQRNLPPAFLKFFQATSDDQPSACSAALQSLSRVVVENVAADKTILGDAARQVLLNTGIHAVQSTPLFGTTGHFYGIISTHFIEPTRLGERAMRYLDLVAARAGHMLDRIRFAETERRLERLRASAETSNRLAHEINNPMQGLTNLLELISADQAVQGQTRLLVDSAKEQLARVTKTVQELLAVDHAATKPATIALANLIGQMREEGGLTAKLQSTPRVMD